jgi:hypothetical protein
VRTIGRALSEFDDGGIRVVAAYYYSQSNHDSRWLLIELGAFAPGATEIKREQVELVTPSGRVVRLATQARWAEDSTRNARLLQQATTSRVDLSNYFPTADSTHLRFFTQRPNDGLVLVQNTVHLMPYQLARGDLLFESPTGLWDKGIYTLVILYAGTEVKLPIELR